MCVYIYSARKVEQKTFHTGPTPRTQIPTWLDGRVVFNLQFTRERYMCDLYVLRPLLCLCHLEKEPDQSTWFFWPVKIIKSGVSSRILTMYPLGSHGKLLENCWKIPHVVPWYSHERMPVWQTWIGRREMLHRWLAANMQEATPHQTGKPFELQLETSVCSGCSQLETSI